LQIALQAAYLSYYMHVQAVVTCLAVRVHPCTPG